MAQTTGNVTTLAGLAAIAPSGTDLFSPYSIREIKRALKRTFIGNSIYVDYDWTHMKLLKEEHYYKNLVLQEGALCFFHTPPTDDKEFTALTVGNGAVFLRGGHTTGSNDIQPHYHAILGHSLDLTELPSHIQG